MVEVQTEPHMLQVTEQSPAKSLVFALAKISEVIDLRAVEIIRDHPETVQTALALAYYRSDLIDVDQKLSLRSELNDIREEYPTVISHLTNETIADVLSEYPFMAWRLEMEKRTLATFPEEVRGTVADSELILKLLIEDGSNRNLTHDDYRNIWTSHQFFGSIEQRISGSKEVILPREELDRFTEIGQRLLITTRMFEVNIGELDLGYSATKPGHEDYLGLISQMAMLSRLIRVHRDSHDAELIQRAKKYREDLSDLYDKAFMRHPERISDLKKRFPAFVGIADLAWAEHPGGPGFTRAEMTNFSHGGND